MIWFMAPILPAIGPADHPPLGRLLNVAPDGLGGHTRFFRYLWCELGRIVGELGDNARILLQDFGLSRLHRLITARATCCRAWRFAGER